MSRLMRKKRLRRDQYPKIRIYAEGQTECDYFEKFKPLTRGKGFTISTDRKTAGKNSLDLVKNVIKKVNHIDIEDKDKIFIVYDADLNISNQEAKTKLLARSFKLIKQFNETHAVKITPIFSNDAFELWFLLHFEDVKKHLWRWNINSRLSKIMGKPYEKPASDMYDYLRKHGDISKAIERSLQMSQCKNPMENPYTNVGSLVNEILRLTS